MTVSAILKLRFQPELYTRLSRASNYYALDKAEIVRMAIRRARSRRFTPPDHKQSMLGTTYGGTVLDVPLTPQTKGAKAHFAREALNWYLLAYEPIPEPLIPNIEHVVYEEEA